MGSRNVWIVSSDTIAQICDLLPANRGRQLLVTSLIKAYGLDRECQVLDVYRAKKEDLERFHAREFVDFLLNRKNYEQIGDSQETTVLKKRLVYADKPEKKTNTDTDNSNSADDTEGYTSGSELESETQRSLETVTDSLGYNEDEVKSTLDKFGLHYDCPLFPQIDEYVLLVASSSISAAKTLLREDKKTPNPVVLNWYGGRHHCMKDKAAGFCYVNDVVLAISVLRNTYKRVFYLDIDLHHGDGVEAAFRTSINVATCSIHRYDIGFFPGTGSLESSGHTRVNIPTKRGLNDESMSCIMEDIVLPYLGRFLPQAVVLQAGCDGLATEDNREWNMTIKGYEKVLKSILDLNLPTLVLGGGGYNHTETAKCWAHLTKVAVGNKEEWDVLPEHGYLDAYEGDGYRFWTDANSRVRPRKNENDREYLQMMKRHIEELG